MTVDAEVVIHRPVREVFEFVTDLRNDSTWWPGIRHSQRLRGDGGPGTVYRLVARFLWFDGTWDIEVTALESPRRMSITGRGPLNYVCHYRFAPDTRVGLTIEIDQSPWLAPLIRAALRRNLRKLDRVIPR